MVALSAVPASATVELATVLDIGAVPERSLHAALHERCESS